MRKIMAACIDRIIDFGSEEEAQEYLDKLSQRKVLSIVWARPVNRGYRVRFREQYNNSPIIGGGV